MNALRYSCLEIAQGHFRSYVGRFNSPARARLAFWFRSVLRWVLCRCSLSVQIYRSDIFRIGPRAVLSPAYPSHSEPFGGWGRLWLFRFASSLPLTLDWCGSESRAVYVCDDGSLNHTQWSKRSSGGAVAPTSLVAPATEDCRLIQYFSGINRRF